MGKALALAVAGTLVFLLIKQNSISGTTIEIVETKAEYQEELIAQEIALSAYSLAERRAETIGGPVDSVIAKINGYATGSFQGGTYQLQASEAAAGSDIVKIRATGFYGGAEHMVEKTFISTTIPEDDWRYGCTSGVGPNHVEIQGFGMGDNGTLLNDGMAVSLVDSSQIRFLKAQVGGKTSDINSVRFTTSAGEDTTLTTPNATGQYNLGYFESPLQTTANVTVDVDIPSRNGARGFVVYAHRRLPHAAFSEGRYLDIRMYHYGHTEVFTIPTASSDRTVYVDFVMYDKDDDGRTVTMTVEANGLSASRTIGMPNMDRELSIETVALHNVPGAVSTVNVSIYTNDSLYWTMAHVYTVSCG